MPKYTGERFGFGRGAAEAGPFSASGGTKFENTDDGYTYHYWTVTLASPYPGTTNTSGSFVVENAPDTFEVDCLLIAGGGGGGYNSPGNSTGGGGGGAGAVIYKEGRPLADGSYPIQVGRGGDPAPQDTGGGVYNGGDTTFNGLTAAGGGAGGYSSGTGVPGSPGGNGGGGGGGDPTYAPAPSDISPAGEGTATTGHPGGIDATSPDTGWGYDGGHGGRTPINYGSGGGGGGIYQVGYIGEGRINYLGGEGAYYNSTRNLGGCGGASALYHIVNPTDDGTVLAWCGGGGAGGAGYEANAGTGGQGSGGTSKSGTFLPSTSAIAGYADQPQQMGKDGTGGGGAGGSRYNMAGGTPDNTDGERGGCGLLQIRYETSTASSNPAGISVTGGTLLAPNPGGYEVRQFHSPSNFVVASGTCTKAMVFLVGGGGAGAYGGGGSGGGVYAEGITFSPTGGPGSDGTYPVTVGEGGDGRAPGAYPGSNGTPSEMEAGPGYKWEAKGGGGCTPPQPGDVNSLTGAFGGSGGGGSHSNVLAGWAQQPTVSQTWAGSPHQPGGSFVNMGNTGSMGGSQQYGSSGGGGGGLMTSGYPAASLSDPGPTYAGGGTGGLGVGPALLTWIPSSYGDSGWFGGGGGGAYGKDYMNAPAPSPDVNCGKGGGKTDRSGSNISGGAGYGGGYGPPINPTDGQPAQPYRTQNTGGGSGGCNGSDSTGADGCVYIRYYAA